MNADVIAALVSEGAELKHAIAARQARLKEITDQLVTLPGGDYTGDGSAKCTVIHPRPGIKLVKEDVEEAEKLAGDSWAKLFDKEVTFSPKKAFRDLAAALLTPSRCSKITALLEKASAPFVKWSI